MQRRYRRREALALLDDTEMRLEGIKGVGDPYVQYQVRGKIGIARIQALWIARWLMSMRRIHVYINASPSTIQDMEVLLMKSSYAVGLPTTHRYHALTIVHESNPPCKI